jgi:hypothetical protein
VDPWERPFVRLPAAALGLGYAFVLTLAFLLAPVGEKPFVYFQF